jgi:hypothetical protein
MLGLLFSFGFAAGSPGSARPIRAAPIRRFFALAPDSLRPRAEKFPRAGKCAAIASFALTIPGNFI